MADGLRIESTGADKAAERLLERAARARDLTPATQVVAAEIDKMTDDAFRHSRSPAGEVFPRLAPSTVAARAAKLPGANRRNKKTGQLTAGARGKRKGARDVYNAHIPGGPRLFTPLIDTGRARNSAHATGDATGVSWTGVGYLGPHITGSQTKPGRPPKRNVSVFHVSGGILSPLPKIEALFLSSIGRYIETGRVR